jgi:dipeptidyl aminopeptidase/acylaminoacyl peptidase
MPAEQIAQTDISYDAARVGPEGLFWIEGRADGRDVLVRWTPAHGCRDLLPADFSAASCVHEYGGGAWAAAGEVVWFCNASDQRIYRADPDGVRPVTPSSDGTRYADLSVHPGRCRLWSVRERRTPGQIVNELVTVPVSREAMPRAVASGWDFYAFPRPSPDGRWLAWTCWNEPLMPWDGTCLYVARVKAGGDLAEPVLVAGGTSESVFQPAWSPDGILHFVSDRDGWWSLYAWNNEEAITVLADKAELGVAQWEFGYSTYAFLEAARIAVIVQRGVRQSLDILDRGQVRHVPLPYTSIKPYLSAHGRQVALIASSASRAPAVVIVNADDGAISEIAGPTPAAAQIALSAAEPFTFTARDGIQIHGLFYQPHDRADAPPPLVIKAHPGPTANVQMRLDWHTQYLTSHGFAVAEINYRGSTGYGREFRILLRGDWGKGDALDCAEAARFLIQQGMADTRRTAIWGASAGGYTALRATMLTDTFVCCIARSPVIDPQTWRRASPKFQARQADSLIGPWPGAASTYQARSVLQNPHAIGCPVLLLHGSADRVTPASQSQALAESLGDRAQLAIFPGQGHTLRSPGVLERVLHLELGFLRATTSPPLNR